MKSSFVPRQLVTANGPKAMKRAQSTRTLTFPQHLKHTCHKLIRMRRVRRRVEQHKLSLLRSTGTLKVSVLKFPCSSLPVGIWPETFPAADRRSRSPRVRGKSVSMFHNVAVRWVWKLFPSSPPPKVLSFSPPRVSQSCPPSSTFRRGAIGVYLLFLLPWWVLPPHSRLSAGSLVSLPTGARGHYTLFHAERGSASDREAERERGWEGGSASAR